MRILKKLKYLLTLLLLLSACGAANAQVWNNLRMKMISNSHDTIMLDTLSIVPQSVHITRLDGSTPDPDDYLLNAANAVLIWKNDSLSSDQAPQQFIITYRVYPFMISSPVYHKKRDFIEKRGSDDYKPYIYSYSNANEDLFKLGGLSKNGSISRGISFGNNQDVVVNSSLNLQLSGKLSEDVGILAAITDNNIPIQPDGNTQQIQEFDKVFIQLFTKKTRLTAGDFELERPRSYFMNLYKKGQGGLLTTSLDLYNKEKKKSDGSLDIAVSGALSKGKYARNQINGIEGNQGPYKLSGNEGETFIIVLAGSEKVYIDGKLLTRGADRDYVIDYNLGEISFTPEQLITKDKRIIVEFEYSDRTYARSMYFASLAYRSKKGNLVFNYFSEQDLKNQPLQQDLSDEEKELLYNIGDTLALAVVPHADSIAFTNNEVLYKKIDTTVNSIVYSPVYVYSTSSDSAFYRLGFSYMGVNKGNYIQIQSAANGRVFRWVAPVAGIPQGSYEPVMVLITPKKTAMYTLGGNVNLGRTTVLGAELAMSDRDENTFSPSGNYDNLGYAARISLENTLRLDKDTVRAWRMVSGVQHEYVQQYFQPVERFRTIEFDRDWNRLAGNYRADEQMPEVHLGFENNKHQFFRYKFRSYLKGSYYKGYRHTLDGAWDLHKFFLNLSGAWLNTDAADYSSVYTRQKVVLSKQFKWITIGASESTENNQLRYPAADSLLGNSAAFEEYEAFIKSSDTAKTGYSASYKRRLDRLPYQGSLRLATTADDASAGLEMLRNPSQSLKIKGTYRMLHINDSTLSNATEENTLLGRIEFYLRKLKKTLTTNTYYEAGSGLEVKKDFSYVEVPAGQGVYSWTDYNGNNIRELNEFDVAAFADQANFIRVFTPTNEYIRAYYSQFSEALNLDPANAWANKKGIRKFISRFSLQFAYRVERKTSDQNLLDAYNPFRSSVNDSNLMSLNSNLKASLYFNKSNAVISTNISYFDNRNKILLVNGFDSKSQQYLSAGIRWNVTKKILINTDANYGLKRSHSDFFTNRAYDIQYVDAMPKFQLQLGKSFRISLLYKYSNKLNTSGILRERAEMHNSGMELKYNIIGKGSLSARFNYILIRFNANDNNPLAYDMLEGYKTGNNANWNVSYQRNLSENLQMNLIYDGRYSEGSKMVHTGSLQLRAFF
jgi:hypothetical protein